MTSNHAKAWHRRWNELVGKAYVGLLSLLKELQKEQDKVESHFEAIIRGVPRPSSSKSQQQREKCLQTAFANRLDKTLLEYLRGIGHNLSL